MSQAYMKEKPVFSLLLTMSLPMVLSMAVNSLYNIIDSFFIAKISEEALTALSLVYPIQNVVNATTIGFAIGINAVVSFYLGAQEQKKANQATSLGFLLALLHGLLLSVLSMLCIRPFLLLYTSDETVLSLGLTYSYLVFGFATVISAGLAFEKIFQAVGMMMISMLCMSAGCITNIILDPILIFGPGPLPALGITGAALATGIGQCSSLVLYLCIFHRKKMPVQISLSAIKPLFSGEIQKEESAFALAGRLYAIGIPATLNLALASILVSALNGILSAYSAGYVLVMGVYYKLQTFLYLPANGVIQGMRPLIGYNYGAKEYRRVRKIFLVTSLMILVIMTAGTVLCQLLPATLIGLFTTNPETVQTGALALRIISLGFVISTVSVACSGSFEGLSMGLPSLVISLCRYIVLILPTAFLLTQAAGPGAIWHAFWITEVLTALISILLLKKKAVW